MEKAQKEVSVADPILNNWRLVGASGDFLGIFVGEVTGHPLLADGWIMTSVVQEIAKDLSSARTLSRRYVLGTPLPDTERLPPGATDAVIARLAKNAGLLYGLAELDELLAYAERLSEAPIKLN